MWEGQSQLWILFLPNQSLTFLFRDIDLKKIYYCPTFQSVFSLLNMKDFYLSPAQAWGMCQGPNDFICLLERISEGSWAYKESSCWTMSQRSWEEVTSGHYYKYSSPINQYIFDCYQNIKRLIYQRKTRCNSRKGLWLPVPGHRSV